MVEKAARTAGLYYRMIVFINNCQESKTIFCGFHEVIEKDTNIVH